MLLLLFILIPFSAFAQNTRFDPHELNGIWLRTGGDRGYNNEVAPMTVWGEEKFKSYKPSYGRELGSADAAAHPEEAIGRRRAVPSALGSDPAGECNPSGVDLFARPRGVSVCPSWTEYID